ncbi:hypothetical protein FAZ15_01205 [Sphingobacterium olei]|uniref:Lipoprotein n=1 Tax=Sphingobacterium olei TaxID=2571155 RepID=A0A4U0P6I5_9SPHI|nr:hypothetical protein [Sphingobacterium olei]TJZ62949.1 hypothetical protein FAZ15_01205 [Sphingobacterium olei]
MRIRVLKIVSTFVFPLLIVISCDRNVKSNGDVPSKVREMPANLESSAPLTSRPGPINVTIEKISSEDFFSAQQRAKMNKPMEKITDFKIVQQKLAEIVEFEDQDNYLGIKKMNFRNASSVKNEVDLSECSFVSYFPSEDILLLECGHTMDVSFDLTTGQTTYETGNPNLVTTSPSGKYRLNKVYEGQECFYHFIQEKKNGKFKKIAELNDIFEKKTGKWLCVTEKEFWADDQTLYFGLVTQYKEGGNDYEFYSVKISEGKN